jgi:hypothetical protein
MSFSRELLSLLVIVAIGLGALALFLLVAAAPRRRADRTQVSAGARAEVVQEEHARVLGQVRGDLQHLAAADAELRERLGAVVQRVGLVRYDAFEDMGGRLSFSLALLTEAGDGVVVSAINGRQDTRVYAKPVVSGASDHNLSEEEAEAIRQAMAGSPRAPA